MEHGHSILSRQTKMSWEPGNQPNNPFKEDINKLLLDKGFSRRRRS
jgi:hypothetical protein